MTCDICGALLGERSVLVRDATLGVEFLVVATPVVDLWNEYLCLSRKPKSCASEWLENNR